MHYLKRRAWWGILVLAAALSASLAACGGDDDQGGGGDGASGSPSVTASPDPATADVQALAALTSADSARIYLQEALSQGIIDTFLFAGATRSQALFDELGAENFEGMYGVSPLPGDPAAAAAFDEAYTAATDNPAGSPGIREGYDAAYLIMMAAVAANSTDPVAIRDHLRYVANPPGMEVGFGPEGFGTAVAALLNGEDINYEGAAGSQDTDVNGDPTKGAVETWRIINGLITAQETRDVDLQAEIGAQVPEASANPSATAPEDALTIGVLLSAAGEGEPGQLIADAIQMAVDEVNSAGGVFGQDVALATGDSGASAGEAQAAAQQLIDDGARAIIGPLVSDPALAVELTLAVAQNVAGPGGITQITPLVTSGALTAADTDDFLFRTVMPDAAQGLALADVANGVGFHTVCALYGPHGEGLPSAFKERFEQNGGAVPNEVAAEAGRSTYVNEIRRCIGD